MAKTKLTLVRGASKPLGTSPPSGDEKLFKRLRWAPAYITEDVAKSIEKKFAEDEGGQCRREGLAVLTAPAAKLVKAIEGGYGDAVAFAQLADALDAYIRELTTSIDLLKGAETRIRLALCSRDDMDAVIAEARHG